jgi:hypothetical protein
LISAFNVNSAEANRWWQKNTVLGVVLNRLMLLFIFGPISLVFMDFYKLSFVVFTLMVPYGLLVRQLAVLSVRNHLAEHPEAVSDFEDQGIIAVDSRARVTGDS